MNLILPLKNEKCAVIIFDDGYNVEFSNDTCMGQVRVIVFGPHFQHGPHVAARSWLCFAGGPMVAWNCMLAGQRP